MVELDIDPTPLPSASLPLHGPTAALSPPERTHMWRRPVMPRDTYRPMQWARASTSALASSPGSGEACGPAALTSHHPGHLTVPPGPSPPHGAVVHCSTPAGLSSPCRSATFVQFQGHFCLVFPLVRAHSSLNLLSARHCSTWSLLPFLGCVQAPPRPLSPGSLGAHTTCQ